MNQKRTLPPSVPRLLSPSLVSSVYALTPPAHQMIPESTLIAMKVKVFLASGIALGAFLADISVPNETPVESYTFKGVLVLAVLYLARELSIERLNNKKEAYDREDRMLEAIKCMTEGHKELVNTTKEQTNYFQTIAKTLIERGINHH